MSDPRSSTGPKPGGDAVAAGDPDADRARHDVRPPRLARMALRVNGARVGSAARPAVDGAATGSGRPVAADPYAARPGRVGPRRFGLRVNAFGGRGPGSGSGSGSDGGEGAA